MILKTTLECFMYILDLGSINSIQLNKQIHFPFRFRFGKYLFKIVSNRFLLFDFSSLLLLFTLGANNILVITTKRADTIQEPVEAEPKLFFLGFEKKKKTGEKKSKENNKRKTTRGERRKTTTKERKGDRHTQTYAHQT